jgi:hypothetical protein
MTPVIQLPLAQPIDLSIRATYLWWNQEPRTLWREEKTEFWRGMTGLTLPQELALRLGRTSDLVSIRTTSATFNRRFRRMEEPVWECVALKHYPTIWRRTHRATTFRIVRNGGAGRLGSDNLLRQLLKWAEPDDVFEDRLLMAAYHQGWGYRRRREHVRTTLVNAERDGYITDIQEVNVSPHVWLPHARWCKHKGIRQPSVKDSALDHGALAVEAALMQQGLRDTTAAVRALRSEADLSSDLRRDHGRTVSAGERLYALPDLEIVTRGGQRFYVEVLSESYRNADMAAKYARIERAVDFVATSRTVALRVVKTNPAATCWHF